MKIALVTLLNELFVIGFKAMLESLLKNNPWFDLPIVILDENLKKETKLELIKRYKKIKFISVRKESYQGFNFNATAKRLRDTYYKLDLFNIRGYHRLVFIDSDVVILRDIKKLFECTAPISAVKGYDCNRDILRRDINSGVLVVNKQYLNAKTYTDLLKVAQSGHKMPDQTTINIHFRNRINFLEKTFNVEKRMLTSRNYRDIFLNASILHYVGEKPWNKKVREMEKQYSSVERKWWEYYHE